MIKKRALVIGKGKWGKIFISRLNKKVKIVKIIRSKENYKKFNYNKIDWVFVLTNTEKHFEICNYLIKKCKNIFCEKPLTKNIKTSLQLIQNSKKFKSNIYISNVEKFKFKKLILKKKNFIERKKFSEDKKDLFLRYVYHDLYTLSDLVDIKNFKKFKLIKKRKGELSYSFEINKKLFNFSYSFNSNKKVHRINSVNFLKFNGNPLDRMIQSIVTKKENKILNNKNALSAIYVINKIQNKL